MNTKPTETLESIIKKSDWYYVSSDLTTTNFPIPETIQTEGWKLIKMNKSFSSQEALDKIKAEGYRPANAYELAVWANTHRETEMPKGVWSSVVAFGQTFPSGGCRRVPYVGAYSVGDFGFGLGGFEDGWNDGPCLLAFCDLSDLGHSAPVKVLDSLAPLDDVELQEAIKVCKKNGLTVSKIY